MGMGSDSKMRAHQVILFTWEHGGRTWVRTRDPLIKSQLLYQLSYASMRWKARVDRVAAGWRVVQSDRAALG